MKPSKQRQPTARAGAKVKEIKKMTINGKNYLLLERRGSEYFHGDEGRDNIGNYRVGSYDYSILGKDGRRYIIEFSSRNAWKVRKTNKRTGKPLKHPITETTMENALAISTEYQEDKDGSGWPQSWRNGEVERSFFEAEPVPYCVESILDFVNGFSADHYDGVLWVVSFQTTRPASENWTPAQLVAEWAKAHRLETLRDKYGSMSVKMYSGLYKYLCCQIAPGNKEKETITAWLERLETA